MPTIPDRPAPQPPPLTLYDRLRAADLIELSTMRPRAREWLKLVILDEDMDRGDILVAMAMARRMKPDGTVDASAASIAADLDEMRDQARAMFS